MKHLVLTALLVALALSCQNVYADNYKSGNGLRDIVTLPYTQNFDGVTAPAMPAGWQVMVSPAGSDAIVNTDSSDAHSAPNSVRFHGGYNGGATLYLIAPLLADSIAVQSVRMRLWLKAISAYQLQVGVMDDPANPASFTLVNTLTFPGSWYELTQSLAAYSGTGRYIALRTVNLTIGGSLLLDDFRLERIWPVDLAALTLDTDTTQSLQVGHPSNFEITVQNLGANLQDIYYVVLCNAINDMQLATANGYNLQPGQTWNVYLTWTPVEAGSFTLYAKVVLTGDGDLSNNHSPNLTIEVTPAGQESVTIGSGNQLARIPMDFYWHNSLYENIYYASELQGSSGFITGIDFYNNFASTNINDKPTRVWLGNTTQSNLGQGWIASDQLTQVFDGNVAYPYGQNLISIPLDTPFLISPGANIVLLMQRPMDNSYYSMGDQFNAQTDAVNRSRVAFSDTDILDPASPPTPSNLSGQFPQITFHINSLFSSLVSGTVSDSGGQALAGASVVLNNGSHSTLTDNNGYYQFYGLVPGTYIIDIEAFGYLPANQSFELSANQQLSINVSLIPLPVVNVTGIVMGSDTGAPIQGATVSLSGYANFAGVTDVSGAFLISGVYAAMAYDCLIIAPGYNTWSGPIALSYSDFNLGTITLSEYAYPPSQVNAVLNDGGTAVLVSWGPPSLENRDLLGYKVWRLPNGQELNPAVWTELTSQPLQGFSFTDNGWISIPNGYYRWAVRSWYGAEVYSEPALSDTLQNLVVNGILAGTVRQTNTGYIAGATVSLAGTSTTTNQSGVYQVIVPVGVHSVTASAPGFISQTVDNVSILEGQVSSLHFVLEVDTSPSDDPVLPVWTSLRGNYPNPFNPSTTIAFSLGIQGRVRLEIYNLKGQLIRVLLDDIKPVGMHQIRFDGLDRHGSPLGNGVYVLKMLAGKEVFSSRMLLLK